MVLGTSALRGANGLCLIPFSVVARPFFTLNKQEITTKEHPIRQSNVICITLRTELSAPGFIHKHFRAVNVED